MSGIETHEDMSGGRLKFTARAPIPEIVEIAEEVIQHFRDVRLIRNLKSSVPIEVLDKEFGDRDEYHEYVTDQIKRRSNKPGIVFLILIRG